MSKNTILLITGALFAFVILPIGIYMYNSQHGEYKNVSWEERDSNVGQLEADLHDLGQSIKKAAGNGQCEYDSHCKVVGLGNATCGAFKNYLIYSTMDADSSTLMKLVGEFNGKRQSLEKLSLSVPGCGVAAAQARCINKRCQVTH